MSEPHQVSAVTEPWCGQCNRPEFRCLCSKAKYIVKRREFDQMTKANMFRRSRASYGPWRTLGKFDSLELAKARCDKETRGLFQVAVFHLGKKVSK